MVHAPRQTGKTTTMKHLARSLTEEGLLAALWFTCEEARPLRDNVGAAEQALWGEIEAAARDRLPEPLRPPARDDAVQGKLLRTQLSRWAAACPRRLVLVFDDIDALRGDALLSLLSQLRAGYASRPAPFPHTVILCGTRDVRAGQHATGPFHAHETSIRLGGFSGPDVRDLFAQHTAVTGQEVTEDAVAHAFELSQGQPWLTNALAREVVERIRVPASVPIEVEHVVEAKERVILERSAHLDALLARLSEARVRSVLGPLLAGDPTAADPLDDDTQYVMDLGLIASDRPIRIANPMYREILFRVLSVTAEHADAP